MFDIQIDFKQFYEEFGIKIKNPIYRDKDISKKYKMMIYLREHYIRHRNIYKKIFHEKNILALMLDSDDSFESSSDKICCAAEQQKNINTGEMTSPYCNLQSIQVVDLLPKEMIPEFRRNIKKIIAKNQGDGFNFNHTEETSFDEYKKVHNSYFRFCAAAFTVKSNSELGKYVSGIEIDMMSLSSSFVGLVCRFYINDVWKDKINTLIINDREKHSFYSGMERLKVYQFRQVSKGHNPGSIYKQAIIGVLLEEIKYRIGREFFKNLNTVIFSMNQKSIAINVFETNINGNSGVHFWESFGIEARFCNYLKQQDACINPLHRNNLDLDYIYRINSSDKYDSQMVAHEIGNRFIEYLNVVGVKNAIEDKITQISIWMQKCKNTNLVMWMKLKARVDNELMYANRFVNEFKSWGYLQPDDYYAKSSVNIAKDAVNYLDETVGKSKKMIDDITLVVNSNVEAQNSTTSYKIQKTTFYTNLFSAIAALIAIIISLLSEERKDSIIHWLENVKIARYMIYIVTLILIFLLLQKVIVEIYRKFKCFIIFRKK